MDFWTIEVLDAGGISGTQWRAAHEDDLTEAAITHGATEWIWTVLEWGVVFQVEFADEVDWLRFRAIPAVRAALDGVPDPLAGLLIYRGRGGGSSSRVPRRPRPAPRAGAVARPEPEPTLFGSADTELRPEPGIAGFTAV